VSEIPTSPVDPPTTPHDQLLQQACDFAARLTRTVQSAFGSEVAPFTARAAEGSTRSRMTVVQQPSTGISLSIDGVPRLLLRVEFWCVWDHAETYLAVDEAKIKILSIDDKEPLFRYEYLRAPTAGQPCAHMQVHAHRDAVTFLMTLSGDGSPRGRRRRAAVHRQGSQPRMAELHFPLGGHRFRPCLEDILEMLLDEFGVDAPAGAKEALCRGRERWRTDQLAAAVRDSPSTAARVLTDLGYTVAPPPEGDRPDRSDRLRAY
jgi:hypothetical protein